MRLNTFQHAHTDTNVHKLMIYIPPSAARDPPCLSISNTPASSTFESIQSEKDTVCTSGCMSAWALYCPVCFKKMQHISGFLTATEAPATSLPVDSSRLHVLSVFLCRCFTCLDVFFFCFVLFFSSSSPSQLYVRGSLKIPEISLP